MMTIFNTTYKIYINHTDAGGIVYHANHLIFLENCRRDWLDSLGFNGYFFDNTNGIKSHFVVSEANLRYRSPLLIDDEIVVTIDDITISAASLLIKQSIYQNQTDFLAGKTASLATVTLACVYHDKQTIRPCRLPNTFKERLIHLKENQ